MGARLPPPRGVMGYGPVHNGVNGGSRRTRVADRPNNVDSWVSLYFVLVCFLRWVHPGPPPLFPPHYNVTNTFAWPCLAAIPVMILASMVRLSVCGVRHLIIQPCDGDNIGPGDNEHQIPPTPM